VICALPQLRIHDVLAVALPVVVEAVAAEAVGAVAGTTQAV
jgi:hypothetical protein